MDFSIIIPSFNRKEYLEQTIISAKTQFLSESVKQQNLQYEIIVVDDQSTDDTKDFVKSQGSLVKYFYNPNKGRTEARNLGAQKASGKYLIFCDDDDLLADDFIFNATQLLKLAKDKNFDAKWIAFNSKNFTSQIVATRTKFENAPDGYWHDFENFSDKINVEEQEIYFTNKSIFSKLLQYQFFLMCAHIIEKKAFLDIGGFNSKLSEIRGEDFHFTARLVENNHHGIVSNNVGALIRRHKNNFSHDNLLTNMGELIILDHLYADKQFKIYDQEIMQQAANYWKNCLFCAFNQWDFDIYIKLYKQFKKFKKHNNLSLTFEKTIRNFLKLVICLCWQFNKSDENKQKVAYIYLNEIKKFSN